MHRTARGRQRSKGGFRAREAAEAFLTDQLARIGRRQLCAAVKDHGG